jgi:hypothetical protein
MSSETEGRAKKREKISVSELIRPNFVISACETLMKDTAYIFKMADKNKTKVIK